MHRVAIALAPASDAAPIAKAEVPSAPADDGVPAQWTRQYPLPPAGPTPLGASHDLTQPQLTKLYRPPRSDARGIATALAVIALFLATYCHAMFGVRLTGPHASHWLNAAATFVALEFLYTGLFITTHDAMHGTIAMRHRRLNDALGWVCISLYAWFDYRMLHRKHWEHHNHTGVPHKDPDFHRGDARLLPWFVRFMTEYMSLSQAVKILAWVHFLQLGVGVPLVNLATYQAGAAILSAFRLFYFGTYLPHLPKDDHELMPWWKSHSPDDPTWLHFLRCYCFGLHWEHHKWPYAPWWDLPKCKSITRAHATHPLQQRQAAAQLQ